MNAKLYLLLIPLFFGCGQEPETAKVEAPVPMKESRYKSLLSKYTNKSFDTLSVYSPEDLTGEYGGHAVDSAEAALFPADIVRQHFDGTPGIFAVYRFDLDNNTVGLITRTPSEYVPASIKLFFFDKLKDTITSYIELAESWGDAGDVWLKDAWIFKSRQAYATFIMVQERHHNSVENENDTTVERQNYFYLLSLSKRADTVSSNGEELVGRFRHLVDKTIR